MTETPELSPIELLKAYIESIVDVEVVPTIIAGPASDAQQEEGVASIMGTGSIRIEPEIPILWPRMQIRCVHRQLYNSEQISRHLYGLLDDVHKVIVTQPSSGQDYLIKEIQVDVAPSHHYDSPDTWETLLFVKCCIGTTPIQGG